MIASGHHLDHGLLLVAVDWHSFVYRHGLVIDHLVGGSGSMTDNSKLD